jgi:hypothetical protein
VDDVKKRILICFDEYKGFFFSIWKEKLIKKEKKKQKVQKEFFLK